jgi:hypothetical protein
MSTPYFNAMQQGAPQSGAAMPVAQGGNPGPAVRGAVAGAAQGGPAGGPPASPGPNIQALGQLLHMAISGDPKARELLGKLLQPGIQGPGRPMPAGGAPVPPPAAGPAYAQSPGAGQ